MILKKDIAFIIALIFFTTLANAQDNAYGPHGGRIKIAGKYKIELFGCDDHVEVYLYDIDTNAISNADITGTVAFYYDGAERSASNGNETASTILTRYGMDGFTAKIPSNNFTTCKPAFDVGGKLVISAKFDNECLISTERKLTSTKK